MASEFQAMKTFRGKQMDKVDFARQQFYQSGEFLRKKILFC